MYRLAILASGSGSNAEAVMKRFQNHSQIEVVLVITNNSNAGVIDRAKRLNTKVEIVNNKTVVNKPLIEVLQENKIDFVVLAGYMKLIPATVTKEYANRIVNIHPALLPKFGGKGMYGMNVHQAVVEANEKESGMTIHYVNEEYDDGNIIFQDRVVLNASDNAEEVAAKVLKLEHQHYPRVIEEVVLKELS